MDVKNFNAIIIAKQKQIEKLINKRMPVIAGRIAKDHFQDNFRQGGFVNGSLQPWQKAKRQTDHNPRAASRYDPLLSSRRHLFSSISYTPSNAKVYIQSALPYAYIHNEGGTINVPITTKMRAFAWAMFYKAAGKKNTSTKKPKRNTAKTNIPSTAALWRGLALTKKTALTVNMPKRQFIGDSKLLNQKINNKIQNEIRKIIY